MPYLRNPLTFVSLRGKRGQGEAIVQSKLTRKFWIRFSDLKIFAMWIAFIDHKRRSLSGTPLTANPLSQRSGHKKRFEIRNARTNGARSRQMERRPELWNWRIRHQNHLRFYSITSEYFVDGSWQYSRHYSPEASNVIFDHQMHQANEWIWPTDGNAPSKTMRVRMVQRKDMAKMSMRIDPRPPSAKEQRSLQSCYCERMRAKKSSCDWV